MAEDIEEWFRKRVSEEVVAHILALVAAVPNKREKPLPTDLQGTYDFWFDGGACTIMTGSNRYDLHDGTVVDVGSCVPVLSVSIRLPDGRRVNVQEGSR